MGCPFSHDLVDDGEPNEEAPKRTLDDDGEPERKKYRVRRSKTEKEQFIKNYKLLDKMTITIMYQNNIAASMGVFVISFQKNILAKSYVIYITSYMYFGELEKALFVGAEFNSYKNEFNNKFDSLRTKYNIANHQATDQEKDDYVRDATVLLDEAKQWIQENKERLIRAGEEKYEQNKGNFNIQNFVVKKTSKPITTTSLTASSTASSTRNPAIKTATTTYTEYNVKIEHPRGKDPQANVRIIVPIENARTSISIKTYPLNELEIAKSVGKQFNALKEEYLKKREELKGSKTKKASKEIIMPIFEEFKENVMKNRDNLIAKGEKEYKENNPLRGVTLEEIPDENLSDLSDVGDVFDDAFDAFDIAIQPYKLTELALSEAEDENEDEEIDEGISNEINEDDLLGDL
jgi:hypothetical protein